jgi:hypothetical protein
VPCRVNWMSRMSPWRVGLVCADWCGPSTLRFGRGTLSSLTVGWSETGAEVGWMSTMWSSLGSNEMGQEDGEDIHEDTARK